MGSHIWDIASIGLIPLIGLAMYAVLISLLQEKLIYMPRRYDGPHAKYYKSQSTEASRILFSIGSSKIISLDYELVDGTEQTAYFLPPTSLRADARKKKKKKKRAQERKRRKEAAQSRSEGNVDDDVVAEEVEVVEEEEEEEGPFHLWMAASGNAGLAMDWLDLAVEFMQETTNKKSTLSSSSTSSTSHGFLLVDYPGYGANDGQPSPATILESTEAVLDRLDQHLALKHARHTKYLLSYVAHSIGCSAVLQHAVLTVRSLFFLNFLKFLLPSSSSSSSSSLGSTFVLFLRLRLFLAHPPVHFISLFSFLAHTHTQLLFLFFFNKN